MWLALPSAPCIAFTCCITEKSTGPTSLQSGYECAFRCERLREPFRVDARAAAISSTSLAGPFKLRWTFDPPITVPLGHDISTVGADGGAVRVPPTLLPWPDLVDGATMWTGVLLHLQQPCDWACLRFSGQRAAVKKSSCASLHPAALDRGSAGPVDVQPDKVKNPLGDWQRTEHEGVW